MPFLEESRDGGHAGHSSRRRLCSTSACAVYTRGRKAAGKSPCFHVPGIVVQWTRKMKKEGEGDKVDISICRQSVCMGDDIDNHTCTYTINPSTMFRDIFLDLIKQKYFPSIFGNDVVWSLFCGDDDLLSWKTKEDKLYSRFGDKEPTILSVERWTASACIDFRYYSPPIKRAKYIFTMFGGSKFHIWHEGFMPEYESYCISRTMEDDWRKVLAGH